MNDNYEKYLKNILIRYKYKNSDSYIYNKLYNDKIIKQYRYTESLSLFNKIINYVCNKYISFKKFIINKIKL